MKRMIKSTQEGQYNLADTLKNVAINIISLIGKGGKRTNVKSYGNNEYRDIISFLPYGISSSGEVGMRVGIIMDDNLPYSIGVNDDTRPDINPGEIIVYSKFGQKIILDNKGDITLITKGGQSIKLSQDKIQLNNGSKPIARKGDSVRINIPNIGDVTGEIISGSDKIMVD